MYEDMGIFNVTWGQIFLTKLESLHTLDLPHHGCRVCKVLTLLQFQAVWAHFSDQKSVWILDRILNLEGF